MARSKPQASQAPISPGVRVGSVVVTSVRPWHRGFQASWECDCGNSGVVPASQLGANSNPCSQCNAQRVEKAGTRFGYLTIVHDAHERVGDLLVARCLCDCGTELSVPIKYLRSGKKKSCGCRRREAGARTRSRLAVHEYEGEKRTVLEIARMSGLDRARLQEQLAKRTISGDRAVELVRAGMKRSKS